LEEKIKEAGGAALDLDPEIRRFIETVASDLAPYPDLERLPLPEVRRVLEQVRARWVEGGPQMAETMELQVPARDGTVGVRIHKPATGRLRPVLVYLHGGGWTFFSLDTHDRLMREYAARAGINVLGVDYALSPEAKFPVALEQVVDVLRWIDAQGREFGISSRRVAVGGDSAGANLAVAASLQMRDSGRPDLIRAMVLNYGAFEANRPEGTGRHYGGPGYMLGYEEMQAYWRNYVRSPADLELPLVCPLRANLFGLPPALLVLPECDVLAEQGHAMATKLRHAEVPVTTRVYEGASHSFLEAVSIAAISRRALSETADWLSGILGRQEGGAVA
jgi:acetyl esterase